jgi:peroxiredoxin
MRTRIAILVAALGAAALPAFAADPKKPEFQIGDAVPEAATKDTEGGTWSLADARSVTAEKALEAVRKVAAGYGAAGTAAADTALDSLSGLKASDGTPDAAKRMEMAKKAGRPFGLLPSEETVAGWKTLGDVAGWVAGGAQSPIVLVWWSPKCPTSTRYEERVYAIARETGARFFAVASNQNDDDASIAAYVQGKGYPFRVLADREGALADRFGAKRTPHVFVLDEKNVLRYSGQIDDDADGESRANWLRDAVRAIADGQPVNVLVTAPKG